MGGIEHFAGGSVPSYNIRTSNTFDNITDADLSSDYEMPYETVDNRRGERKRRRTVNNNNNSTPIEPKITIPIIKAYNIDVKAVSTAMRIGIGANNFAIINRNSNLSNELNYNETLSILKTMKCKTITRTMDHLKPINMILKGVHCTFLEEDVKTELVASTSCKILKAYKFTTPKSKRESKDLNLYFIQFASATKVQDIIKIKRLFGQELTWDIFIRTDVIQCHRCQRFGHVSSNCEMPFRCIKCDSAHLPGECGKDIYEHTINEHGEVLYKRDPEGKRIKATDVNGIALRKKDDKGIEIKPFCVCCKKEGHPANFKGCEAYQLIMNSRRAREQERLLEQKKHLDNHTRPGVSFSSIAKHNYNANTFSFKDYPALGNNSQNDAKPASTPISTSTPTLSTPKNPVYQNTQVHNTSTIGNSNALDFIEMECDSLFGKNLSSIIKTVKDFLPKYKQLTDETDKQTNLIKLIMSIIESP